MALLASKVLASLANAPTISKPARISSSSKIGLRVLVVSRSLETSRLRLAIVCSPFLPVRFCCSASLLMTMVPPLMPLRVTLLASSLALMAIGMVALRSLSFFGRSVPGVCVPPLVALPCWSLPTSR
ncbi:hypothetical protein D9M68_920180 [compost metagenome]